MNEKSLEVEMTEEELAELLEDLPRILEELMEETNGSASDQGEN